MSTRVIVNRGRFRRNRRRVRRTLMSGTATALAVRTPVSRFLRLQRSLSSVGYFKLRGSDPMSSDAANLLRYRYSISRPDAFLSINGAAYGGVLQDWTNFAALYDMFKVTGIQLKWIPHKPNDTSTITNYRPVYLVMDPNDTIQPNTVGQAIQFEKCIIKNLYRPFTVYFRIPKLISTVGLQGGWLSTGGTPTTGSITVLADDLDLSDNYGHMIATYYIQGKVRN